MKEIWKDIDYTNGNYQISNLGRVKSKERYVYRNIYVKEKIIKLSKDVRGYLFIHIRNYPKSTIFVHRLVAQAFIPNPNNLREVNHIDGNKQNNCVDNLEWVTHRENMKHSYDNLNHNAIISMVNKRKKKVAQLKNGIVVNIFESASEAGRELNIPQGTISNIANHKKYYSQYRGYTFEYISQ